jgi:hypothetical protein
MLKMHGKMDDDSDWSDFKKSEALKTADDEMRECRRSRRIG